MVSPPPALPMDAAAPALPACGDDARYQRLFESLDEGFCVIELLFDDRGHPSDYRYLEANAAYHRHTGQAAVVGKTARELFPRIEQEWLETYVRALRTGEPQRLRHHLAAIGRWFDVCAMRDGPAGSTRLSLLAIEATARVVADQRQQALAQCLEASNRRKSEFLATLAHELRNPLAPMNNAVHMLRFSREAGVRQRAVTLMDRQLTHMKRLVDDLLDIARVDAGKITLRRQHLDLRQVAQEVVEACRPLIDDAGHQLRVELPAQPVWIDGDPTRLHQVLCNLVNNAVKYTPAPGQLSLTLRVEGGQACVRVSDNGLGIPSESLPRVFNLFEQLDTPEGRGRGGLGIGLALVRAFTEMHGGQVRADSAGPDQGSTFTVTLPLLADALVAAPPSPATDPASPTHAISVVAAEPGERSILVVDDNEDAAESLALILQMNGHVARVAHDGAGALTQAAQWQPDVVFLDIGLPGMDGYAVARALRALPRDGKRPAMMLVALTGWGSQEDRARAKEAGFDHHLTKPADIAAVERLLAGAHAPV